jgi:hypothetical protein
MATPGDWLSAPELRRFAAHPVVALNGPPPTPAPRVLTPPRDGPMRPPTLSFTDRSYGRQTFGCALSRGSIVARDPPITAVSRTGRGERYLPGDALFVKILVIGSDITRYSTGRISIAANPGGPTVGSAAIGRARAQGRRRAPDPCSDP